MPETDVPAIAEGGKAAMMTEDEVEHLENAETSVRAAVLGKGDGNDNIEREIDRSVAGSPVRFDIGTP